MKGDVAKKLWANEREQTNIISKEEEYKVE